MRVALQFIRVHHRNINVDAITEGSLLDDQGNLISIEDQIPAIEKVAKQIIDHMDLGP